jgi:hypothetical protein
MNNFHHKVLLFNKLESGVFEELLNGIVIIFLNVVWSSDDNVFVIFEFLSQVKKPDLVLN